MDMEVLQLMAITTENIDIATDTLYDFLTCNPFTERGLRSLCRLSLDDLFESSEWRQWFFDYLYVKPKYEMSYEDIVSYGDEHITGYPFSENRDEFEKRKRKKSNFEKRLRKTADMLMFIYAPSGNGKSIQLHHLLYELEKDSSDGFRCSIIYNLEKVRTIITQAKIRYKVPCKYEDEDYYLWLFCLHLLDDLYRLIAYNSKYDGDILFTTYENTFSSSKKTVAAEDEFFLAIKNFSNTNDISEKVLFESLLSFINEEDVSESIYALLKMTIWFLYCQNGKSLNYIAFDNIEQYVPLNDIDAGNYAPIFNQSIFRIAKCIYDLCSNQMSDFRELKERLYISTEFSDHFKFIMVIRHTTKGSLPYLSNTNVQIFDEANDNTIDVYRWFDFSEVYKKRKEHLIPYLREKLEDNAYSKFSEIINIFEMILGDNRATHEGSSIMEMLETFLNGSHRRLARSLSDMVYYLNDIFNETDNSCINLDDFTMLWRAENSKLCKFLIRRTIIECYMKQVVRTNNWEHLCLGSIRESSVVSGMTGMLARRILVFLSRSINENNVLEPVRLIDLIKSVYTYEDEQQKELNLNDHFKPLAKVLYALSQLSYRNTKWSPWVVINFSDNLINMDYSFDVLANKLDEIWKAYTEIRKDSNSSQHLDEKYPKHICGVRITRAGLFFVSTIQPDFSYFAALYCNDETPLLFLTDTTRAEKIIEDVYNKAKKYIKVVNRFEFSFFKNGSYDYRNSDFKNALVKKHLVLRIPGEEVTLQERIIYQHHMYLKHYSIFLERHGKDLFHNSSIHSLKNKVYEYIQKYEDYFEKLKEQGHVVSTSCLYHN